MCNIFHFQIQSNTEIFPLSLSFLTSPASKTWFRSGQGRQKKSTPQKQPPPIHLRFTEAYLVKIKFLRYIKICLDCPGQSALADALWEDLKNLDHFNETLQSEARFSSSLMKDEKVLEEQIVAIFHLFWIRWLRYLDTSWGHTMSSHPNSLIIDRTGCGWRSDRALLGMSKAKRVKPVFKERRTWHHVNNFSV